ncbi:MAG: DEAD/DEAH box helicase, partial [Pseudohongiella sp.]|nr:DEAD/DEAH box helicase [Pseudohongiella sp.]
MSLSAFHPASRAWFETTLGQPTPAQADAWPNIKAGRHTLIAAPTGSGKTLAAFYAAIDELVWQAQKAALPAVTRILYISPLKALSNDIERNLQLPLAGIEDELFMQGAHPAGIRVAVRTGDTPQSDRQKMLKNPPHILVTTPESVYLLLTSIHGRNMLRGVTTVIIDEIHAMLGDKRGSHLSLSLERLQALTRQPFQRIGLSATQKPIDMVANYLVGNHPGASCAIVDSGYSRKRDIRIEVPSSPLSALMSNEVWAELYERLVELIKQHHTTLVFVNTRRLSERLAMALSERLGADSLFGDAGASLVSSHHGSMSKERRHKAEQQLKAGKLKVLVATASMELGIDIGAVDLVVQFASPNSIATFLQRVGRSGHSVGGTPKGILFPLTRDDLVECTALVESIHRGELDKILMPEQPLDILSQQIVAELAALQDEDPSPQSLDDLFALMTRAWPYRNLERSVFDELIVMLADGYSTRLGRRGAWLHLDRIHQRVSARRGARLTALTNGGAIPDMFDYQVVLDPDDIVVGNLNEDFALETLPGDIFTLGTHSWQLMKVDGLKVRVRDAHGQKPSVPFWIGEGPGRTAELSLSVSRLRSSIDDYLLSEGPDKAVLWLTAELGLPRSAALQLVDYLHAGRKALQVMPTQSTIVMERFFDEVGDMHVVIHAPFGSRLNKAWGLALRKRFCRTFNFELQ